ncbi:MAG: FAD-binding protein [Parachlamydiaceae bacterium]|nr:FAD-binding protein [Parachlamydiaceae bacterium]
MTSFHEELKELLEGEVHFDPITLRAYSVDASIYEMEPLGVVCPRNREQLLKVMEIAKRHAIPVIARGAATGIAGGCIGPGLILDLSKYLDKILEINFAEEYVICEPGVVQDQLNAALSSAGYRLGPDTSTGNRATIGGMLANNAAGARSLYYGKMVDHVESVTLALSGGELIKLEPLSEELLQQKRSQENREAAIYRTIQKIQEEYFEEIKAHFPKIPRRVSGYNLDELIKAEKLNLAKIIAGSEGTLGIAVEIKLKISKKPKLTGLCIIHCDDMLKAMHKVPELLSYQLLSLEMLDAKIIEAGRNHPSIRDKLQWLVGDPQAILIAELQDENEELLKIKLEHFHTAAKKLNISYASALLTEPVAMSSVWEVRKAGLGLLLSKRSYSRAIAFIEDVSVAPENLANFMEAFLLCLKSFGKEAGIYGHVGSGCMHIRPYIDLRSHDEQQLMEKLMLSVADLLLVHGGALSGEHGDGYVRSWLNEMMFGKKLYQAFCKLKAAFDPDNLLNPGKIVHAQALLHDLRSATENSPSPLKTFLDFAQEGGLELAADLCNGNGLCRKTEGVMCPSFQATRDEYDTTRARAQALRAIIHGHLPKDSIASRELYDVLDLCLQCKGCKSECPSQVDMAKMKSEVLYHYQEKHGYSLRTRLFGNLGAISRFFSPLASFVNYLGSSTISKNLLSRIGISPERALPKLAIERFSSWFDRQPKRVDLTKKVVLFNDTYTEFNHPEIGKAAVAVLNAIGYEVIVPPWNCCGRTLFSKGMLREAKKKAIVLISSLKPYVEADLPIIGLEPSCLSMLKDDLQGLVGGDKLVKKIAELSTTFDAFLYRHIVNAKFPITLSDEKMHFLIHGHCHHKSSGEIPSTVALINLMPGCSAELIDSGCCGMAGSFGYEKEHYEISLKIGELKLFPAILKEAITTGLIANGISCRQQIMAGTGRRALHLAEVIAARLLD